MEKKNVKQWLLLRVNAFDLSKGANFAMIHHHPDACPAELQKQKQQRV
jgi:hypothetical protein